MPFAEFLSGLLVLAVLIAITAFFVAAEYSLVTSRKTRLQTLSDQGNASAQLVLKVMEDPVRFFATAQLGITACALAIGSFAEEPISNFFISALNFSQSSLLSNVSYVLGSLLGLTLATYLQVVLAELVPRSLTLRHAERIALVLVPIMRVIATVLTPFTWALKHSSRAVLRLLRLNPDDATQRHYSIEELKMLVQESQLSGVIEVEEQAMLNAVFSFGDTTVREVMMPRTEIIAIDVEATLGQAVQTFSEHEFNRILVYEGNLDRVIGVLHSRDMLHALLPAMPRRTVRQLMREALLVPDSQRADELLAQFRARRESLAVVLDEYGGTAGLVTLTDLSARIIGQVSDSDKDRTPDIQLTGDGAVINGLTSIGDVNEAFDVNLIDDNYDTIGGYVMGRLGRIPIAGDEVVLNTPATGDPAMIIRVETMDKMRVSQVRLFRRVSNVGSVADKASGSG